MGHVLIREIFSAQITKLISDTVKLGDKERFDKEQIGVKELFTDYQPFYTINLLLDKELLPIWNVPKLGVNPKKSGGGGCGSPSVRRSPAISHMIILWSQNFLTLSINIPSTR